MNYVECPGCLPPWHFSKVPLTWKVRICPPRARSFPSPLLLRGQGQRREDHGHYWQARTHGQHHRLRRSSIGVDHLERAELCRMDGTVPAVAVVVVPFWAHYQLDPGQGSVMIEDGIIDSTGTRQCVFIGCTLALRCIMRPGRVSMSTAVNTGLYAYHDFTLVKPRPETHKKGSS